ncbi:hypothetical protein Thermus77412_17580 [Thermus antranikianii]
MKGTYCFPGSLEEKSQEAQGQHKGQEVVAVRAFRKAGQGHRRLLFRRGMGSERRPLVGLGGIRAALLLRRLSVDGGFPFPLYPFLLRKGHPRPRRFDGNEK